MTSYPLKIGNVLYFRQDPQVPEEFIIGNSVVEIGYPERVGTVVGLENRSNIRIMSVIFDDEYDTIDLFKPEEITNVKQPRRTIQARSDQTVS